MIGLSLKNYKTAILIWILLNSPMIFAQNSDPDALDALIRLSANHIDSVFDDVASSSRALAVEYVSLSTHTAKATTDEKKIWLSCYQGTVKLTKKTTIISRNNFPLDQ